MRKSGTGVATIFISVFLSFFVASLVFSSALHAQSPFYQGKSIRLIIGSQAGSLYDGWARLFASHMGRHIPGNPAIVGQNMAGAGSVIAANQLYNVAKPDGLTIGALLPGIYMDQLIGRKEVQFDWARFNWLGTPEQTEWVFITRRDSPFKTIEDIRTAKESPKCGSTGTGSFLYLVPKLMEESLGTKFTMITGYQGGPDVDLAMERGEVHCRAVSTTAYFGREPYLTWGKNGFVLPLAQTGKKRETSLADVSTLYELMEQYKTPETGRRLATVILAANIFGRPIVTPPGVSGERLRTLREAWNRTVKDGEFLAEAKKRGWPVEPLAGEELESLAKEVIAQPPEVVQRLKKLLGE
jgi:tripartite-type tricarboxylate transporter receptor subunit TctC